ncbi:DUF192 domain-containing protein [Sphingomonas gilva]|uniref:DUF192 domain-containing protein n=2 Tax=Sphingomonas gilva TaxID=2305907 RepID=A0A396RT00_9SPHN|nr:DUF192 domain-containing protein [Sphingomonas gilva]RHW17503.1 DUF192 domain-containing protein [Sphingomonas gilva]
MPGCNATTDAATSANGEAAKQLAPVTIRTADGKTHIFQAEIADTVELQQRGLMYRTDLGPQSAMLFAPYPPEGPPRVASFWMQNTPTSLDIVFIRADGTIASIAENTVPYSTDPIPSGEPVAAVLELVAGRTAELGISEDDRVSWPGGPSAN